MLLLLVLVLCSSLFLIYQILNRQKHLDQNSTANIPPGSRGLPLIGETIQFIRAVNSNKGFYDFVRNRHIRYGNCFKTRIFGETHVFLSSTESAKAILNNESGKFTKKYIKSIGELVGDRSLLCASPHHHKLIRGRLANLFSTSSVSGFIRQFDESIIKTLGEWENEGTVIVLDQALEITFRAMCKMLMSLESEDEVVEMLKEDVASICKAMLAFPIKLPWTRFYKGLKARRRIINTLGKIMSERRCSQTEREDFLQYLLTEDDKACSDGNPSLMTDAEIQDNILTMIIAGQDTTASAITWMVKYLGENQKVLSLLRDEQLQIAEKNLNKSFLSLGDLNEMPYASKVVKESLRMASIVPWLPRSVLQDSEIEGFKIKTGWNIDIDARSIHLDPMIYKDPNKFNPSRFDDEAKPYSFLAFGVGPRTCLGINMARAMMLVFLHRLVTTFK
ncbi:abscisic acid 8'-hydroxylase 4 isoform X2 [Tripterygium wilfordii]|nr:abscisic acid 8'-hydroxylase 4 isoform X2 [Tripterygium wilfordii]